MSTHSSASQSWIQLTSLQVGGSICLPVIATGHLLSQEYGLFTAIMAILAGNLILLGLALVATSMGSVSRKNTVEHATIYFGEQSSYLFAALMSLCMLGWFAIQLNMMHQSLETVLNSFNIGLFNPLIKLLLLGFLTTWLVRKGLKTMGWMANIGMPILFFTLAYSIYTAPAPDVSTFDSSTFVVQAITFVMAINIAAVIDMPNLYRFAKSKRDAIISTILVFGVGQPLIEGVGVYLASGLPDLNLIDALNGGRTDFWIPLFLLAGGWITNNTNLFSATVSSEKLLPSLSREHRALLLGALGTLIACGNPAEHLEMIVNCMGIAISSMGGVIFSGHLMDGMKKSENSRTHMLCWAMGAFVGFFGEFTHLTVTGISLLDAFFTAMILTSIKILIDKKENIWSYLPSKT